MMSLLGTTITELCPVKRKMFIQTIERETWLLKYVCDQYKIQDIYERTVDEEGWALRFVSDQ